MKYKSRTDWYKRGSPVLERKVLYYVAWTISTSLMLLSVVLAAVAVWCLRDIPDLLLTCQLLFIAWGLSWIAWMVLPSGKEE